MDWRACRWWTLGAGDASRGGGGEFSGDGGGASGRGGESASEADDFAFFVLVEPARTSKLRLQARLGVIQYFHGVSRAQGASSRLSRGCRLLGLFRFRRGLADRFLRLGALLRRLLLYDSTLDRRITERERQLTQRFRRFRQRQAFTLTTRVGIGRRCVFVALFVRVNVDRFRSLAPPSTHFRLLLRVRELDSQPTHIVPRRAKLFDPPSLLLFHSRSDHSQRSRQRTLARLGRFGAFPRLRRLRSQLRETDPNASRQSRARTSIPAFRFLPPFRRLERESPLASRAPIRRFQK